MQRLRRGASNSSPLLQPGLLRMMTRTAGASRQARANEIRNFRPPRSQRSRFARFLRAAARDRRGLRSRRFLLVSHRRAPRDAARPRRFAQRLPRRGRAAHSESSVRPARLHPAAASSAAGGRGNLHARSDEPRTLRPRRRPRHLSDRDRLLWGRPRSPAEDVSRSASDPAPGADRQDAELCRRVLPLCRRADGARAVPEAAPAVLGRRRHARRRRGRRTQRLRHGRQRAHAGHSRDDRPLSRRLPGRARGYRGPCRCWGCAAS